MKFSESPSVLSKEDFVRRFGGIYEHSPWVAERAWDKGFTQAHHQFDALAREMAEVVNSATHEQQLNLILAHPDLAGKAAVAGKLTNESTLEQSSAGIDQCDAQEFKKFQALNTAYRKRFNFPFIMAVKGSDRHKILHAFERRLPNDYQTEFDEALEQIHKIARFRLIGALTD